MKSIKYGDLKARPKPSCEISSFLVRMTKTPLLSVVGYGILLTIATFPIVPSFDTRISLFLTIMLTSCLYLSSLTKTHVSQFTFPSTISVLVISPKFPLGKYSAVVNPCQPILALVTQSLPTEKTSQSSGILPISVSLNLVSFIALSLF